MSRWGARAPPPPLGPPPPPPGALPSGEGGLGEGREVVLAEESLRRRPHRLYVQRLRHLPDESHEQCGPLPPVVDGVAVPAGGGPPPGGGGPPGPPPPPPRHLVRAGG